MDPHQALGHAEATRDPVIPCGLCGKPWEAYATDDDGIKLCQACAELPHQCPGTDDDGKPLKPDAVTCGACAGSWCGRCDPGRGCHFCAGRGYSDAELSPPSEPAPEPKPLELRPKDAAMLRAWELLRNASAFQKLEGLPGVAKIVSAARVELRQAMGAKAYAETVNIENKRGAFPDDVSG